MKQVLYVDILMAVNLFVNYFILVATSKFMCIKWKTRRLVAGEILGAIYSLYIFLPELNIFISLAIKLFMAFTIVWAVFGIQNFKTFVKTLACFYSVSFAFSGIIFSVWCIWKPNGMTINNGVVYFNISPIVLIFSTLIAYTVIEIINRITGKKENKNRWCDIDVSFDGKSTVFKAKIDTCNSLREPFSNLPVIVTRENTIASLLPPNLEIKTNYSELCGEIFQNKNIKMRIIPFRTVSGEGLLPAFKPDFIRTGTGVKKQAYIAICSDKILPKETPALMNPDLLD